MSGKGDPRIYYREHVLTINTPRYIHSVPGILACGHAWRCPIRAIARASQALDGDECKVSVSGFRSLSFSRITSSSVASLALSV